jgi:hypothetical protein
MTISSVNYNEKRGSERNLPIPSPQSKSRTWKELGCNGVLLTICMFMLLVTSIPFQPLRSYYTPKPFQERDIQHLNRTKIGIECLSKFQIEATCPPSFFETISDLSLSADHANEDFCEHVCPVPISNRPAFHLQLASEQSEQGSFLKRLKSLGFQNLTHSRNSKGSTGSTVIYDRLERPIGIFKSGYNIGDLIARRIAASSRQIHCPEAIQVYLSSRNFAGNERSCEFGVLTEYVPHIERAITILPTSPAAHFANVPTASLQASAALHLLINERDRHADNVLVRLDGTLESIDHDNSLSRHMLYDFASLVGNRANENLMPNQTQRPMILNRPFWMDTQLVDRVRQPIDPQVAEWIQSLDIRNTIGTLSQPISDFLQTRLEVLRAAVREGVSLPDLYSYLTPHHFNLFAVLHDRDRGVETILDDYTTAIQLANRSFRDLNAQSDETLRASFYRYFEQIVALRVQVLAGHLSPNQFHEIMAQSLEAVQPA